MLYFVLKYLHIVGAAVLLGTGSGIAFFMLAAHLGGKPSVIAGVARIVVIADFIFTATAVIAQPITGSLLVLHVGYSFWEGWIVWSMVLYVITGALWLPVVWMQMRLRDLAAKSADSLRLLKRHLSQPLRELADALRASEPASQHAPIPRDRTQVAAPGKR